MIAVNLSLVPARADADGEYPDNALGISAFLAGYAIANIWIGTPLVAAGTLKLAYDLLVYRSFRRIRSPDEAHAN